MKNIYHLSGLLFFIFLTQSCFKEIDTEPLPRLIEETFTVQEQITKVQTYYRLYENAALVVDTTSFGRFDLAFESAGDGNRMLLGFATYSTIIGSGKYGIAEISQQMILDSIAHPDNWFFVDPTYLNNLDSVPTSKWEDGEVYFQNRGRIDDNYYVIQFVSRDEDSYTFRYASALALDQVHEVTIPRNESFNYVYYSYDTHTIVPVEPIRTTWDFVFTPYRGWWETDELGVFAPFNMSGVMINNEYGVCVAKITDPDLDYLDLDSTSVKEFEFSDMKGVIGSDWKVLGSTSSSKIITVNPDYKYLLSKYDYETDRVMYFKMRILDYYLSDDTHMDESHHPLVEFKYLGSDLRE